MCCVAALNLQHEIAPKEKYCGIERTIIFFLCKFRNLQYIFIITERFELQLLSVVEYFAKYKRLECQDLFAGIDAGQHVHSHFSLAKPRWVELLLSWETIQKSKVSKHFGEDDVE